jgi:Rod binding domain-containing protein
VTIDAIQRTAPSTDSSPAGPVAGSRPGAKTATKPGPLVQFEAFVLQSFIQSIMPQESTAVFGEGTAGEVWKSMLAEKIAMQVSEAGGVGIAKMIAPKSNTTANIPEGAMPGVKPAAADRLLEMQAGAAHGTGLAAGKTALDSLGSTASLRAPTVK